MYFHWCVLKLSHAHAHILQHSSSTQAQALATQCLGQGGRKVRKPAFLGLQGPICVTATYCSTQSSMLSHSISQTALFTIPTCCPVSLQKKTQGWGTTSSRGQTLIFLSFPCSPQQRRSIFWLMVSRSPSSSHGLHQLLCLDACHPSHPKFSAGYGVPDDRKQKGHSFITPRLT